MSAWAALAGAAGYALGGVPGALIGSSIGGGLDANQQRADIAESANAFSANQYATRYQTQVKDMEAAGLNPMLAYMQSPGSAPTGQQYQVTNPYESASRDYASAYNVKRQGENIEADTEEKGSRIALNEAQKDLVNESVDKVKAEVENAKSDNARIKALTDSLIEQKQLFYKQGLTQQAQGDMLRATADKLKAEIPYMSSKQFLADAQRELINTENQLKGFDVTAAQNFNNLGRNAGQLKVVVDILKMFVK